MSPKFVIFLVFCFGIGQFLALMMDATWYGPTETSIYNQVISFNLITLTDIGIVKIPLPNLGYFTSLWQMFWWDYPFLQGSWGLFKWLFLYPLTIGAVWPLMTFLSSLVFGLFRRQ